MDNEKDFREIDENGVELSDVKETEILCGVYAADHGYDE